MNDFIMYIFKSVVWIVVFYGIYRFFFRNETFFRFNRKFLLVGMIAPFILALCRFHYPVEVIRFALPEANSLTANDTAAVSFNRTDFFLPVYMAGAFMTLLYYGFGLNKIRKLIRKRNANSGEKSNIIHVPGIRSPFSFFGYVFMNPQAELQDIEKKLILIHETAHVEQFHWIDILLAQLVCIFQWFNPFAWLYLNAVKQNHEFLADRSVIDKGYSPAVYQAILINSTFGIPVFAFTNAFAPVNKFKRIEIMKKKVSKPAKKWAVLLLLPAFAGFLAAFAQPEYRYSVLPSLTETEAPVPQDTVKKPENVKTPVKVTGSKPAKTHPDMEVSGQVLDTDGKPIAGAAVIQRNGKQGTITGLNGKFVLKTDLNGELKIVYFDKEEAIVKLTDITKGKPISITLKDEQKISVREVERTETFRDINLKLIDIGENDTTRIYADQPLIIVDGQYTTCMSDITADNIESVEVLKDQYAVSKYGEKGKNGVVIIKTKKPTP